MTSREGLNRPRIRQAASNLDQVLTPLGRASAAGSSVANSTTVNSTPVSTTVVQTSGNIRARRNLTNANPDNDSNTTADIIISDSGAMPPIATFDAEQFRSEIKANGNDEQRLGELILNAINYFITTSKRTPQQSVDYTVLPFLAWTASLHGEVFRTTPVLKAMCSLLKGSALTKGTKIFPPVNNGNSLGLTTTAPYTLVCQILWIAYKVRIANIHQKRNPLSNA